MGTVSFSGYSGWKKFLSLFLVLLLVEVTLEIVYEVVGGVVFGGRWIRDPLTEVLQHMSWLLVVTTPVLYVFVLRRLQMESKQAREIWKLAHQDELTGLYNRRHLKHELGRLLENARQANHQGKRCHRFAVMFIDLDRFKNVNDLLGHDIGDEALKVLASRIAESLDECNVVGRSGGDEFVVVVPHIDQIGDATDVAENILQRIQEKIVIDGYELYFTASIGIATYPSCGETVTDILRCADTAMYEAKRHGRNGWHVHMPSIQGQRYSKFQLQHDLRSAIVNNEGFYMEYQPQVDVQTGIVVGMEALVRWKHPSMGTIPPMEFIPLAEESGFIVDLGQMILRTVCAQIGKWGASGKRLIPISVNVSQAELGQSDFVERFISTLKEQNVSPTQIGIEVTETALMKDMEEARRKLQQLREYGVRILIDDFGNGYNSLATLRELPLDVMKVDRGFVGAIHTNVTDKNIFSALVTLAHANGLGVVAEGVECDEQLSILHEMGCDSYQGFIFSAPLSADKFAETYLLVGEICPES